MLATLTMLKSVTDGQRNEQSDGITIAYNRVLHRDQDEGSAGIPLDGG